MTTAPRLALLLALAGGAVAVGQHASAQGRPSGCILDHCQDKLGPSADPSGDGRAAPGGTRPRPAPEPEASPDPAPARPARPSFGPASVAPGAFDFYVLALSWSPSFCAGRGGSRNSAQCDAGSRLGFVVHGLWPQNERGFPQDCDGDRNPSRIALEATRGVYPDEGLARYEWRKHGTCTGRSPADYFADVRRARDLVTVPADFTAPRADRSVAPADVQRAFFSANPRLRPGMMSIGCSGGQMQEVRVCLTKDLRDFRTCPDVARQSCRAGSIDVPPVN